MEGVRHGREIAAERRRIVLCRRARRPRKRYRYRLRRLTPVGVAVILAGLGGAWVGSRAGEHADRRRCVASGPAPSRSCRSSRQSRPRPSGCSSAARSSAIGSSRGSLGAAAVLVDARTGRVLWAKHAHERRQVASTTKIMTALLALRKLGPHDLVTVDKSVPRVPLVREGLRAGEKVEAWKLFYSLLLFSGNDDALALAIAVGGDKWTFIRSMNAEAQRLGLHDTHFSTPSGVKDADNYSSAWDLAALTRVALRNERFRQIVQHAGRST